MKKIVVFILIIVIALNAWGQTPSSNMSAKFGTIAIKVWGEVVAPGIYDVPVGYDLLGVLSTAGGPVNTAKLTNVKVIRGYRLDKDDPIVVYVDLDKYIETGDESLIPEIREGDTIMVPPKFGKNFMTNLVAILAIAQSITIITFYIDRIGEGI